MKITTAYPVYVNKKRIAGSNEWLYVDETPTTSAPATTPTPTQVSEMGKKGFSWDKVQGWVKKGKEIGEQTGVFDWIKSQIGIGKKPKTQPSPAPAPVSTMPPKQDGGMSTTTMLLIGGGVVVAGIFAYAMLKSKNATPSAK
jgi:hypothetical protein